MLQILIHIGLLARESALHFGELAYKGGPLGELVQWSDLITSLYLLGHDVTVTADILDMARYVHLAGAHQQHLLLCLGVNPFPSRFIYRMALRGDFARTQFKDPIKIELHVDRVYCFTSHFPRI